MTEVDGVVYEVDCAMITEGAVTVGAYNPHLLLRPAHGKPNSIADDPYPSRHRRQRVRRGG